MRNDGKGHLHKDLSLLSGSLAASDPPSPSPAGPRAIPLRLQAGSAFRRPRSQGSHIHMQFSRCLFPSRCPQGYFYLTLTVGKCQDKSASERWQVTACPGTTSLELVQLPSASPAANTPQPSFLKGSDAQALTRGVGEGGAADSTG